MYGCLLPSASKLESCTVLKCNIISRKLVAIKESFESKLLLNLNESKYSKMLIRTILGPCAESGTKGKHVVRIMDTCISHVVYEQKKMHYNLRQFKNTHLTDLFS